MCVWGSKVKMGFKKMKSSKQAYRLVTGRQSKTGKQIQRGKEAGHKQTESLNGDNKAGQGHQITKPTSL